MVNARRLDATLEPKHLHTVMIMLMVTRRAMIGLLHMMLTCPVLVIRILMVMMMLMVTTCSLTNRSPVQPVLCNDFAL